MPRLLHLQKQKQQLLYRGTMDVKVMCLNCGSRYKSLRSSKICRFLWSSTVIMNSHNYQLSDGVITQVLQQCRVSQKLTQDWLFQVFSALLLTLTVIITSPKTTISLEVLSFKNNEHHFLDLLVFSCRNSVMGDVLLTFWINFKHFYEENKYTRKKKQSKGNCCFTCSSILLPDTCQYETRR